MKNTKHTSPARRSIICLLILLLCLAGLPQPVAASTQTMPASLSAKAVLSATGSLAGIRISWSQAAYAEGYKIYRSDSQSGTYRLLKTIVSGSTRTYTDYSISPDRFYYYRIQAYHKHLLSTHSSALSAPVKAIYVRVSQITLSHPTATLYAGKTLKLSAVTVGTIAPYRSTVSKITFRSSNPTVATVDSSGTITAVNPGTATITASCSDVNFHTVSSFCRMTVYESMRVPLPAGSYAVTSSYGWRTPIQTATGLSSSFHAGIDLATYNKAIPVYAAKSGTVVQTGRSNASGNFVLIRHGDDGLYTFYGHLSRISVGNGAMVNKNTVIGLTGSTGISTGIHLHFAISRTTRYWTQEDTLDPSRFIRFA